LALSLWVPTVGSAGQASNPPGRGKLSPPLADHIDALADEPVQIIVDGDADQIDKLTKRHNLMLKRRLRRGGVITVTGGQLDALARDPDVGQISADSVVRPTMAVTSQAIGADQVWAGALGLPSLTGQGVGIAIIDSGIADHPDLQGRVIASVDFVKRSSGGVKARAASRTRGPRAGRHDRQSVTIAHPHSHPQEVTPCGA